MKKFKKLSALLLAVVMTLAMALPVAAASTITATTNAPTGHKAPLSVSGLNENDEVTFYQIMKVTYNSDGQVMPEANWDVATGTGMTDDLAAKLRGAAAGNEQDIQSLANGIKDGTITAIGISDPVKANSSGTATLADMYAGTYIAIVTKASKVTDPVFNKDITPTYNPIMLSSGFDGEGNFKTAGEDISVGTKYGTNGTAKSSKPTVAKEITGGTTADQRAEGTKLEDEYDEDEFTPAGSDFAKGKGKKTAALNETINYEVQVVVPAYPDGAVNKSLWMTDTFDTGITFDGINTITVNDVYTVTETVDKGYNTIENADGDIVGWVKKTSNKTVGDKTTKDAIEIIFNYDVAKTLESPLSVKYTGHLNEDAEIGRRPNLNTVDYYYTTDSNSGGTYKPGENENQPDKAHESDEEAAYTYKVALIKTDANSNRLPGAKFVIKDETGKYYNAATKKFDLTIEGFDPDDFEAAGAEIMTSDANGLVEHSGLEKVGTYTFVEIEAPQDYTLVEGTSVDVKACWDTATYSKYERSYTTEKPSDDAQAVGYILNGEYLTDAEYAELSDEDKEAAQAAYLLAESNDLNSVTNPDKLVPAGIAKGDLMNSKTPVLPSTGGMGTYIFTIAGVAILAIAASLLIFKRRKADK